MWPRRRRSSKVHLRFLRGPLLAFDRRYRSPAVNSRTHSLSLSSALPKWDGGAINAYVDTAQTGPSVRRRPCRLRRSFPGGVRRRKRERRSGRWGGNREKSRGGGGSDSGGRGCARKRIRPWALGQRDGTSRCDASRRAASGREGLETAECIGDPPPRGIDRAKERDGQPEAGKCDRCAAAVVKGKVK
ncbi:hypothetical protein HPB51_008269 [Rhipicephalus microplus]|uniref:Uncharacterized protein n=1 Tax=Rhipicephalus microplus TaxID=6941 RepID=A0A9J6EZT7_RHIMP|nr:hypothetical protein HPB51_008269 [Rhipicephalus microplus]